MPFVEAALNYLIPMVEKPVNYAYEPPAGILRSNAIYKAHKVLIQNARSITQDLSLDQHGFTFVNHYSTVKDFYDDKEICRVYYAEAEHLLVALTGASTALVFDHNVRNLDRAQRGESNAKEL